MENLHSHACLYGIPPLIHVSLWNACIHTRVFSEYLHSYTCLYGIRPLTLVTLWITSTHTRAYTEYFYSYTRLYCVHRDSVTFTMYIQHDQSILRNTYKMQVKTFLFLKLKSSGLWLQEKLHAISVRAYRTCAAWKWKFRESVSVVWGYTVGCPTPCLRLLNRNHFMSLRRMSVTANFSKPKPINNGNVPI